LFFYEFAELETGDGAFGIFSTFFLNGFLTFDGDAETSALAFANIGPIYLVVEEIQQKTPDDGNANDPNCKTKKMKHRELVFW
jgi:hypothetical protein